MKEYATYPRGRRQERWYRASRNAGTCVHCGRQSQWRSVQNRCWRCELEAIKARRPLYLDREILQQYSGN